MGSLDHASRRGLRHIPSFRPGRVPKEQKDVDVSGAEVLRIRDRQMLVAMGKHPRVEDEPVSDETCVDLTDP